MEPFGVSFERLDTTWRSRSVPAFFLVFFFYLIELDFVKDNGTE